MKRNMDLELTAYYGVRTKFLKINSGTAMNRNRSPKKIGLFARIGAQYAGALSPVALSATSAWLIVTGLKGLAGFTVTRQTALADLIGILLVVAVARWLQSRSGAK